MLFVLLPMIHLPLGDTAADLPLKLTGTILFLHLAVSRSTVGVPLWPGGESSSIAAAALALITHTAAHYSSPWGDADRGARASVGGRTWQRKMLFTDGSIKKPTVSKQCFGCAV